MEIVLGLVIAACCALVYWVWVLNGAIIEMLDTEKQLLDHQTGILRREAQRECNKRLGERTSTS